jgi:RHS repeat-associated protein
MANGNSNYDYDPIGNRVFSSLNAATNTYTVNSLNQYSRLQPSDQQPINLSYDFDGNMLTNGVWSYTWDAENRLTAACSNNTLLVSNVYDHQSRRIAKGVFEITQSGNNAIRQCFLVYDGWNLVQETIHNSQHTITNSYTWGLDLSGTLQGAGGVGGLLAVYRNNSAFLPCFDANGNITEYIDASGAIRAHFTFDACGNTISLSGDMSDDLSYRFSTKSFCTITGLSEFEFRMYNPRISRWLSREPLGIVTGPHPYMFVFNNTEYFFDFLGLDPITLTPGP